MKSSILLWFSLVFSFPVFSQLSSLEFNEYSLLNKKLPVISFFTNNGAVLSNNDFKGKVVILNFSYFTCGPCMREIPYFNELYKKFEKSSFYILTIVPHVMDDIKTYNGNIDTSSVFCRIRRRYGYERINYPVIAGCSQRTHSSKRSIGFDCHDIFDKFFIKEYPTTIIIDKAGIVRYAYHGFSPDSDKELFKDMEIKITKLLLISQ